MNRIGNKAHINIVLEIILISMLAASLCACSVDTVGDNVQPEDTVVSETDSDENETEEESSSDDVRRRYP